jgi:PAS domain S-box-containing protein
MAEFKKESVRMESEEKFRSITENAVDAIIMIDNDGKVIFWNATAEKIFGYTAEEVTGKEGHLLMAPQEYHHAYRMGFEKFRATGQGSVLGKTLELSAIKKDGSAFPVEISLSAIRINESWHAAAIIRDITERRMLSECLAEGKRFAENLLENSAVATFVLNPQHKVVLWNKACEELTGMCSADVIGTDDHWKPFYAHKRQTLADVVIEQNHESLPFLYDKYSHSTLVSNGLHAGGWYQNLNSRKRYIVFDAAPIYSSSGELTHVIETLQDITERKKIEEQLDVYRTRLENLVVERTEELRKANEQLKTDIAFRKKTEDALRRSEARFKEAQRVARLGTWEWDIEKDEIYWSDEVYRMFGIDPQKVSPVRWTFLDYIHPDDRERIREIFSAAYDEKKALQSNAKARRSDGNLITVQLQGKVYSDSNGRPSVMLGNIQDITEREKMEEEIGKIQKLESIGVLAGGIAHDFNNMLSAILGNISLASNHAKPGDRIFELLQEAGKAGRRAKNLSHQLLTFSKGGEPVKHVISIAELVRDVTEIALMGCSVRAVHSMGETLRTAEVDEGQISQVIYNIVINAKQAMDSAGKIATLCENICIDAVCVLPLPKGDYVKISIRDEGPGIPEEYIKKIFDPYFSTKQSGTGLGLAVSFAIIKKHQGHITVESEPGTGTVFHIYLPASEKNICRSDNRKPEILSGSGKVLVMDDEEVIRLIIGKMLEDLGYSPVIVEDGERAIEEYRKAVESGETFQAVIMDLTVRDGMGGSECIRELQTIDPEVKAIVSSGYSDDPILSRYREAGFKGIMTKPYQLEDLSHILSKVIQRTNKCDSSL